MSKNNNLGDLLLSVANAIRAKKGTSETINPQDFDSEIASIVTSGLTEDEAEYKGYIFTPTPTTVKTSASTTTNVATNINLGIVTEETEESVLVNTDLGVVSRKTDLKGNARIFKRWTVAEFNKRWERNNFVRTGLTEPIGLAIKCGGRGWRLMTFGYFTANAKYYDVTGTAAVDHQNNLQHSHWFNGGSPFYNGVASGTDSEADIAGHTDASGVAGKMLSAAWSVVAGDDADHLKFYSANTGRYFQFPKLYSSSAPNAFTDDAENRTEYLWQFTEWYRHSFAVYSGKTTTELADNGNVSVLILDANGQQAAVGADMYFWLSDGANKVNTGLLAKYNINAQHGTTGGSGYMPLRSAVADAIYASQVAKGINMNDTGVNSASKPVLANAGCKGAEAILVGDKWMIATPTITRASTTFTLDYNVPDAPAVAWARNIMGLGMSDDHLGLAYYFNRNTNSPQRSTNLIYQLMNYLKTEGWFDTTGLYNRMIYYTSGYGSNALWSSARNNACYAWYVYVNCGNVSKPYTYGRYRVACAAAL